ncbi:hypothetical protein EVAR_28840_1 [Eumeta japonica]|uniref:Uncharacterized protein n=1 Tax=Eumeta variegata TaxID=151549 RepID=A0A4C1WGY6_EUMVA|nr:hypothetical protein EVAR_28840_1 [Eumeta japonica]
MGFDFCSFVLFAYLPTRRPAHTFICARPNPRPPAPRSIDHNIIAIIGAARFKPAVASRGKIENMAAAGRPARSRRIGARVPVAHSQLHSPSINPPGIKYPVFTQEVGNVVVTPLGLRISVGGDDDLLWRKEEAHPVTFTVATPKIRILKFISSRGRVEFFGSSNFVITEFTFLDIMASYQPFCERSEDESLRRSPTGIVSGRRFESYNTKKKIQTRQTQQKPSAELENIESRQYNEWPAAVLIPACKSSLVGECGKFGEPPWPGSHHTRAGFAPRRRVRRTTEAPSS